ncbi:MAG: ABC transporter permease [Planctomycetes bacterium]|nr:ABC transporter permease [Planctomycetota bacterium]
MYKSFLSWRYLLRRPVNLIGIVGILVGVGALILILSIMSGFLEETRKTVRGSLSDLIIEPSNLPRRDSRTVPVDPARVLALVRADPRVAGACAQLTWFGLLTTTGRDAPVQIFDPQNASRSGVMLFGIDPADEFQVSELHRALVADGAGAEPVADPDHPFALPPDYEPDGKPLPRVVVGVQLAEAFDLRRGSVINIVTANPQPDDKEFKPSNRLFLVAGTFRTKDNETDLARIYMDRRELMDLLGPPREFSQVLVKLKDYARDSKAVRDELGERLYRAGLTAGYTREVRTWEEFKQTLLGAIGNEKVLMAIMLSLVLLVAGFTVYAILSMMVTEKRRDIGILCALGAPPSGIQILFLMIGFWDVLLGATLGAVIGVWGAIQIDPLERFLSHTFGVEIFDRSVYLFDYIPSVVDPVSVALIVLGAFVCTFVFSIWPAWRASRLHPLDALRYE